MNLTVDLNQIRQNITRLKAVLQGTAFYFMVKADAYNHGLDRCALHTYDIVDGYGVATAQEGQRLRRLGILHPIIVTCPTIKDVAISRENRLILEVGNFSILDNIKSNTTIDIKVDTGMHRQGFLYNDINKVIGICSKRHLTIRGVSTHFMSNECAYLQMCRFYDCVNIFNQNGIYPIYHYIATPTINSGFPKGDFARIGIGAYGYGHKDCLPAMTATSSIINIKKVPKQQPVGYGGAYVLCKDANIALVGGGYYDGISRAYSGAKVYIAGKYYQIVARVNMDSFFVDMGEDYYKVGTEVEVIGKNNSADMVANKIGSIPYEILTSFKGDRWTRNYRL